MNKFLSIYPQLCEPKIGDKVVMEENYKYLWKKGDVGEIIRIIAKDGNKSLYDIDFNNCGNTQVYQDGKWPALQIDFEPYHGS